MSINLSNYNILSNYAILAYSGITTVNTTTVSNGNIGSFPIQAYIGAFVFNGSPSGIDSLNAGTAQTQLTTFVNDINTYRTSLPNSSLSTNYGNIIITFNSNINYNIVSSLTFSGTTIIFDGQNNPNSQFFITASEGAITFANVPSITFINGASNCNIFWLAGSAISFNGTMPLSIPGIFIAGSAISFANGSSILGRLYAETANINFSGTSSVDTICNSAPISCFKEDTKILCLIDNVEKYIPIQNIRNGDFIKTYSSSFKKVVHIGYRKFINPGGKERIQEKLYRCTKKNYPELIEDLYITGCHSILVDKLTTKQLKEIKKLYNTFYITEGLCRLMAVFDEKSEPVEEENEITIWHLALDNESKYSNYGIFANGLLVETTSIRMITEVSNMKLITENYTVSNIKLK